MLYVSVFLFDSLYLYRLINTMEQLMFEQFQHMYLSINTQVSVCIILTNILLGRRYFYSQFMDEKNWGLGKVSRLSTVTPSGRSGTHIRVWLIPKSVFLAMMMMMI